MSVSSFQSVTTGTGTMGVIGGGRMGLGITRRFRAVLPGTTQILIFEANADALASLRASISRLGLENVEVVDSLSSLSACSLVVEAITEALDAKLALFRKIATIVTSECIVASNSSTFGPNVLFEDFPSRERCIGLHFFFPAHQNPGLEIVPGRQTYSSLVGEIRTFMVNAGMRAFQVNDSPGFAMNPVFILTALAAIQLVASGASPEKVDAVIKETCGNEPFRIADIIGLNPILAAAIPHLTEVFPWVKEPPKILLERLRSGKKWRSSDELPLDTDSDTALHIKHIYIGALWVGLLTIHKRNICRPEDLFGAYPALFATRSPLEYLDPTFNPGVNDSMGAYTRQTIGAQMPLILTPEIIESLPKL